MIPACGGSQPPAAIPSAPPGASAEPVAKPEPKPEPEAKKPDSEKPSEQAKDTPPPAPAAPEKPKSATQIGGVSLSDIEEKQLVAAAQKIGWAPQNVAVSSGTVGKYENIRFTVQNGAQEGRIELVRPAHQPTGSSASMMPPKEQKAMADGTSAVLYDEAADLILMVTIADKPAEAKKLLDRLLKGK